MDRVSRSAAVMRFCHETARTLTDPLAIEMRIHRLIPLLLLATACSSDPLSTAALNLEVEASLSTDLPLLLSFYAENRGSETVYLAACDHRVVPIVQRRVDGEWVDQNSAICLGNVSGVPVALEPGETAEGGVPPGGAGEYRIGVIVSTAADTDAFRTVSSGSVTIP